MNTPNVIIKSRPHEGPHKATKMDAGSDRRMCVAYDGLLVFHRSIGYTGQQSHADVPKMMERGGALITGAGRIAGCSCPDNLIPKFLGLSVQYFHGSVGRLLQQRRVAYLQTMRQAAANAGK